MSAGVRADSARHCVRDTAQPGSRGPGADAVRMLFGKSGDRERVGNAPPAADLFGRPSAAGRLQHDGPCGVRDQKTVVIGEPGMLVAAAAPLAVRFEQLDHHANGRLGIVGPLQREAEDVHAGQAEFGIRLVREDRFVADDEAVLVGPHLGPPHPEGAAEQDRVRLGDLRNLDPRAAQRRALRVLSAGDAIPGPGLRSGRGRNSWRTGPSGDRRRPACHT